MSSMQLAFVFGTILLACSPLGWSQEISSAPESCRLPPLETFVLEPMQVECLNLWVPAHRSGPIINRACVARTACLYSCLLPAGVHQTKSYTCPDAAARLLAEYVAPRHEEHLPLTIADGWRWEYLYSLSRYESASYNLPARGGGWDYALEAILVLSEATAVSQWLQADDASGRTAPSTAETMHSDIEVFGFNLVRPRDGYPKAQQF